MKPTMFFKLDETSGTTVIDSSGHNNNLVNRTPSTITLGVPGIANDGGTAYNLTTANSFLSAPVGGFRPSASHMFIAFVDGTYSSPGIHTIACSYLLCLMVSNGHVGVVDASVRPPIREKLYTAVTLADNTPHLIVLTLGAHQSTCSISIDGSPLTQFGTRCGSGRGMAPGFEIGALTFGYFPQQGFQGTVDDVAYFLDTPVSQSQICGIAVSGGSNAACPTPTPSATPTPTPTPTSTPTPTPTPFIPVYASQPGPASGYQISVFNGFQSGNIAPVYIMGPGAYFSVPGSAASHNGSLYVQMTGNVNGTGQPAILAFALGQSGNITPTLSISGSNTMLSGIYGHIANLVVDGSANIFTGVSLSTGAGIARFAAGANGNVAPDAVLAAANQVGTATALAVQSDGTLWVSNNSDPSNTSIGNVVAFHAGFTSADQPYDVITGPSTQIGSPRAIGVDASGRIYVLTRDGNTTANTRVVVFAAGASGDAVPIQVLEGASTGFTNAGSMAVDANGGIFVDDLANGIEYFPPGSTGNVAPLRDINGSNTQMISGFGDSIGM